jgi:hypothetical protein
MKRVSITKEVAYGSALDRLTGLDTPPPPVKTEKPRAPRPEKAPPPAKVQPVEPSGPDTIKLSVFLRGAEDAYLESLASTAKFSGGKKLSKTRLIEAMVRAFRNTKLDVRGVKTYEELLKRVIAQLRQ